MDLHGVIRCISLFDGSGHLRNLTSADPANRRRVRPWGEKWVSSCSSCRVGNVVVRRCLSCLGFPVNT